jgi:hypothetical protein
VERLHQGMCNTPAGSAFPPVTARKTARREQEKTHEERDPDDLDPL